MGKEDYATTGGALKLKGAKDAGITKKKKKKKAKSEATASSADGTPKPEEGTSDEIAAAELVDPLAGKTEAERRFHERKWKMMDEKLKKEGVKTHKERVEEYNRYLASLSEHHDMPRIGPG